MGVLCSGYFGAIVKVGTGSIEVTMSWWWWILVRKDLVDVTSIVIKGMIMLEGVKPLSSLGLWFAAETMLNNKVVKRGVGIKVDRSRVIVTLDIHVGEHVKRLDLNGTNEGTSMVGNIVGKYKGRSMMGRCCVVGFVRAMGMDRVVITR
jgi:hypothetical protein